MSPETVRALLEELAGPTYAGDFTDLLMLRACAADEGEDKAVRLDAERHAAELLDDLAAALAAEMAPREPVTA